MVTDHGTRFTPRQSVSFGPGTFRAFLGRGRPSQIGSPKARKASRDGACSRCHNSAEIPSRAFSTIHSGSDISGIVNSVSDMASATSASIRPFFWRRS